MEQIHEMEKVLFVADELTGLIWTAVLMRPSKSVKDMELKSLKKKSIRARVLLSDVPVKSLSVGHRSSARSWTNCLK